MTCKAQSLKRPVQKESFGGTVGLAFASELTKFLLKYAPEMPAQIEESPTAI
jgi:hypothetical protein